MELAEKSLRLLIKHHWKGNIIVDLYTFTEILRKTEEYFYLIIESFEDCLLKYFLLFLSSKYKLFNRMQTLTFDLIILNQGKIENETSSKIYFRRVKKCFQFTVSPGK